MGRGPPSLGKNPGALKGFRHTLGLGLSRARPWPSSAHSAGAPRGGRNAIEKRWPLSTMCDVAGPRRHECSVVNSHVAPFHITCLLKHAAQYGTPPFPKLWNFSSEEGVGARERPTKGKGNDKERTQDYMVHPLCVPLRRRLGLRRINLH